MIKMSVSNEGLFKIYDQSEDKVFLGCTQEWYTTEWQRRAGCGPTTACNLISYRTKKLSLGDTDQDISRKEECLALMEELWQYVTPTNRGVNTTRLFYEPMEKYIKEKGLDVKYEYMDIPENPALRPGFDKLMDFIKGALDQDAPIAFLNLCNGEEKNLDHWHWVTIISLEYSDDGDIAFINILDEGRVKIIDLVLWYKTTTLGGGFVYLK